MSAPGADLLFFHNPPGSDRLLRQLFVGRDYELERLAERIPGTIPGTIRAIHGDSRVGKSHLALRFLADLKPYHLVCVPASSGKKARFILRELYSQLRKRLWEVYDRHQKQADSLQVLHPTTLDALTPEEVQRGEEGVSSYQFLMEAIEHIEEFDALLVDGSKSLEESDSEQTEESLGIEAKPQSIGLTGGHKQTAGRTRKFLREPPSEQGLTNTIRLIAEALSRTTGQRVVIYADDVDLLDVGPDADQAEVVLLVRCLHQLAQSDDITVVTSLRTRHLQIGDKELSEAVRVEPMSEEDIREIYNRHVTSFHGGVPVMDESCLRELLAHAAGKVGVFLRLCSQFREYGLRHRPRKCLDKQDLLDFYRGEIQKCLRVPDHRKYVDAVVQALKTSTEVELDGEVLKTPIVHLLLVEPLEPGVPKLFDINHLANKALRAMYPSILSPIPEPIPVVQAVVTTASQAE